MGSICEWLCPKRKVNQGPYDVHQQTFEMDDQIGDLGDPYNSQKPANPQSYHVPESEQNLNEIRVSSEGLGSQESGRDIDEKKFIQQKNQIKEQSSDKNQPEPVKQQQKPKFNILPSKIKKKAVNKDDYRFINQNEQFKVKKVDSLNKQQFNIDNCKNSQYFIFDITANVYIDDSSDCFIFIAPCQSTIFIRNCKNMVIIAATGQFRTYQCHNCHFSLLCKSQPVIQSSSEIHFENFMCPEYGLLFKQFQQTKLYGWNNNWCIIHNFTPKEGEEHYTLHSSRSYDTFIDWQKAFQEAQLQIVNQEQKIVPFIHGKLQYDNNIYSQKCILIFNSEISSNDQKIMNWLSQRKLLILKSHKNKFDGHGDDKIIVLEVAYSEDEQLNLQQVDNPTQVIEKEELQRCSSKYFISFGDQR